MSAVAGVGATLVGVLIMSLVKIKDDQKMSLVLSYSAGFMIALVVFDMIPEAIEKSGIWIFTLALVVGLALMGGIDILIEKKVSKLQSVQDSKSRASEILILIAMCLHNLPEGMALGALEVVKNAVAFTILLSIHNIFEGMAIGASLQNNNEKIGVAILSGILAGLPTVIGAMIGFGISNISSTFVTVCLALSSSAMIYVVFKELLAQSYEKGNKLVAGFSTIAGLVIGMVIIYLV